MRPIKSLRFRLVMTFVIVFGCIQVILSGVGLAVRERNLWDSFDSELMQRAESLSADLAASDRRLTGDELSTMALKKSAEIYFREFYVQIARPTGELVSRSANLGEYRLPTPAEQVERAKHGLPSIETLSGKEVQDVAGAGQKVRMVTLMVRDNMQGGPYCLQVGASLRRLQESIASLRLILILGIPIGLATAALASGFVIEPALHQIGALADLAKHLTPENLDARLSTPKTHDEVGAMVDGVNHMLDRLEAGFKSQERFIQDASHELKTPVSVLISEAQVLEIGNPSIEDYRSFVRSTREEMQRLGKMFESLLMLTRSEGRSAVASRTIDSLNDVVLSAVRSCKPLAEQSNVRLAVKLDDGGEGESQELTLHGDADLVIAMIGNLIRNAIRFSPAGNVVEVEVNYESDHADIHIRDNGPGIPESEIDRIFERFERGSNVGSRRGTGLGLAIARSIVDLHHGSIGAKNRPEGGCVFTATLPLAGSDMTSSTRAST